MKSNEDIIQEYIRRVIEGQSLYENNRVITPEELESIAKDLGLSEWDLKQIEKQFHVQRNLGYSFAKRADWIRTADCWEVAQGLNPYDEDTMTDLAQVYKAMWRIHFSQEHKHKAILLAKTCLSIYPENILMSSLIAELSQQSVVGLIFSRLFGAPFEPKFRFKRQNNQAPPTETTYSKTDINHLQNLLNDANAKALVSTEKIHLPPEIEIDSFHLVQGAAVATTDGQRFWVRSGRYLHNWEANNLVVFLAEGSNAMIEYGNGHIIFVQRGAMLTMSGKINNTQIIYEPNAQLICDELSGKNHFIPIQKMEAKSLPNNGLFIKIENY
jgi:hypothetical protein